MKKKLILPQGVSLEDAIKNMVLFDNDLHERAIKCKYRTKDHYCTLKKKDVHLLNMCIGCEYLPESDMDIEFVLSGQPDNNLSVEQYLKEKLERHIKKFEEFGLDEKIKNAVEIIKENPEDNYELVLERYGQKFIDKCLENKVFNEPVLGKKLEFVGGDFF